jgi:hypothetical protein
MDKGNFGCVGSARLMRVVDMTFVVKPGTSLLGRVHDFLRVCEMRVGGERRPEQLRRRWIMLISADGLPHY